MNRFFLSLVLCSGLTAATAPDSIAGKVYRSNIISKGTSPRFRDEVTLIFEDSRRFIFLKSAHGLDFTNWNRAKVEIVLPRPDGSYQYQRLTETQARVTLNFDDGTETVLSLEFTSPNGGGSGPAIPGALTATTSFFLSDYTQNRGAAPSNISMRGTVVPGKPVIVGFIVPGTPVSPRSATQYLPAFGEKSQEVLIRVIGPSLRSFGMENVWTDPDFELYKGENPAEVDEKHNPDWDSAPGVGSGLKKIFGHVSAFPLLPQSKDAVDVTRLTPGAYTIVCNVLPGEVGGDVLVEVYFLP